MEASEFVATRDKQLKDFKSQYETLKSDYSSAVVNALKEQDRSKQCILIKQVLDTNKKITGLLTAFRGNADPGTCKSNPELGHIIQKDLEAYNKEHEDIQQGRDQLAALKNAIERTKEKTKGVVESFSWFAILIFISIVALIFVVVFRVGSSVFNAQPGASVAPGSLG
jgi:Fe2+ transport system protein B